MREYTAHVETVNTMTGSAILDCQIHARHDRMADCLISCTHTATSWIVAGIATLTCYGNIAVIRISRNESRGRVTVTAITRRRIVND